MKPNVVGLLKGIFVKATIIVQALSEGSLNDVDYKSISNQVDNSQLVIGFVTRQRLNKMLGDGSINATMANVFYSSARNFFCRSNTIST